MLVGFFTVLKDFKLYDSTYIKSVCVCVCVCVCVLVAQLCPTLFTIPWTVARQAPMGHAHGIVRGILQARKLEWVAIS